MAKRKANREELLQDEKVKSILECFLINGVNKDVKYYSLLKFTGLPRSTLYDKLQRLKEEGIIYQSKIGEPYKLSEKYYNLVFHKHLLDKINRFSSNLMIPCHTNDMLDVVYGIHPDLLDDGEKKKLNSATFDLWHTLWNVKLRQVEKILKQCSKDILFESKKMSEDEKKLLYNSIQNIFKFTSYLCERYGRNLQIEEIEKHVKREYSPLDNKGKIKVISKIISLVLPKFSKIYPPSFSYCLYMNIQDAYVLRWGLYFREKELLTPEKKRYLDISTYLIDKEWDYIHYIKTEVEFAKERIYHASIYGDDKERKEAESDLKYWQEQEKEIDKFLQKNPERKKYQKKKIIEWIKFRVANLLSALLTVENIDILKEFPYIYEKPKEYLEHRRLNSLKYWIKRYKKLTGYSSQSIIKNIIQDKRVIEGVIAETSGYISGYTGKKFTIKEASTLLNELEEKMEYFMKEYC